MSCTRSVSEGLKDDWAYINMMARRSEFPFRYLTRYTALGSCPVSNCNKQFHTGPSQVGTHTSLRGSLPTRVLDQGKRQNTELWGTAPYKSRGDGELHFANTSNQLMRQPHFWQECARPLSELPYNRYDYIAFPNRAEYWRRGGEATRLGPIYVQPVPM